MILKTERLQQLFDLVPDGTIAADVATDHAWLAVALVHHGKCPRAIASDLRPAPLVFARENVTQHQLDDRVDVRLGHGMTTLAPGEAETVIIAGVGMGVMREIIDDTDPVELGVRTLILQTPQDAHRLVDELEERGMLVHDELLLDEAGKHYHTIVVHPQRTPPPRDHRPLVSERLLAHRHRPLANMLARRLRVHDLKINGISASKTPDHALIATLEAQKEELQRLLSSLLSELD